MVSSTNATWRLLRDVIFSMFVSDSGIQNSHLKNGMAFFVLFLICCVCVFVLTENFNLMWKWVRHNIKSIMRRLQQSQNSSPNLSSTLRLFLFFVCLFLYFGDIDWLYSIFTKDLQRKIQWSHEWTLSQKQIWEIFFNKPLWITKEFTALPLSSFDATRIG